MNLTVTFALLGGLLVLAFGANRLFRLTRVPDVLVLMGAGLLLGPGLGWIDARVFEPITNIFGTLALIMILFEGGLELDLRDTLRHFPGGLVLSLLGYTLSVLLVAAVLHWGLSFSPLSSLLVGAVLGCTSSAVVLPVLQQIELRIPVKVTLLLEASLGDVLGVLTVGVLRDLTAHRGGVLTEFVGGFLVEVGLSLVFALLAGVIWSRLLPRLSEQRFWNVLTFSVVLLLYAGAQAAGASGLIAVLGFGLTLANFPGIDRRLVETAVGLEAPAQEHHHQILTFHSELAFLVRSFFFVLIGVVVKLAGLSAHLLLMLGVLGALFAARWLAVHASRWSWREISPQERQLVLFMLPRGLITAVLALQVFAARGGSFAFLPELAFAVILVTNLMVVYACVRAPRPAPTPALSGAPVNGDKRGPATAAASSSTREKSTTA